MPFPKFEFSGTPLAKPANPLNRGQEPPPARKPEDSQALLNLAKVANPEHPPTPGLASLAEISSTLASPANREKDDQGRKNQGGLAGLATLAGGESKTQNTTPWHTLLAQVEPLARRLVELQAPRLRVDLEGRAVGYRSLEGLSPEGVTSLLREMLESLARQYPDPSGPVQIIGLWPGTPSQPVRREVLAELEAEDDTAWF